MERWGETGEGPNHLTQRQFGGFLGVFLEARKNRRLKKQDQCDDQESSPDLHH